MEAVGVDRGVGGTGWQSRSEGTFKTDAWQGLGLDSGLAAETRQKINVGSAENLAEKAPRRRGAPGVVHREETGRSARSTPSICQRDRDGTRDALPVKRCSKSHVASDRYARPHRGARALSAVQIRSRAQGIAGRTAAPPARREGGTPTDMAGKETPPVGLPQANIQAAPRTRMGRESGSPITAITSYCADHSTGARNVEPVT